MAECGVESEILDAALKEYVRSVADARDVSHLCEAHRQRCEDVDRYDRDELAAAEDFLTKLMGFVRCVTKKRL